MIWDNLLHLKQLQTLTQNKSEKSTLKPGHNFEFSQTRLGTPVMVLVDRKVVCIGPWVTKNLGASYRDDDDHQ